MTKISERGISQDSTLLFLLLAASLCSGCTGDDTRDSASLLGRATPQAQEERQYRDVLGEAVDSFGVEDSVFNPLSVVVDESESAYILDKSDMRIKKIDHAGNFVRSFGKGIGEGPGDFMRLQSIAVTESGDLLALDGANRRLTKFDSTGNLLWILHLPYNAGDVAEAGDSAFTLRTELGEHLLAVVDSAGHELFTGPRVGRHPSTHMPFLGRMIAAGNGGIVYMPLYAGYLAGYSSSLEQRYYVETIDSSPFPIIEREGENEISLNASSTRGIYAPAAVVDDTVYTMHALRGANFVNLDAYSDRDGMYLYSTRIEKTCFPASVTRAHVYLICDAATVVKYERER